MKFLVALLFSLVSLSGFANEAHSLRLGATRAEVEKMIESPLVADDTSIFKNAFQVKTLTPSLRGKLPGPFSALSFQYATFYFNDAGKLWRVRFEASTMPANEAFKAFVDTTSLLEGDSRLKPDPAEHVGKKFGWQVPMIKRCQSEEGELFNLNQKALKEVRAKWKGYTQAERFSLSMACGVDAYVGNLFADKQHGRHQVSFERVSGLTPQTVQAALAGPQATVVFLLIQTSAQVPGVAQTEESMHKPQ